MSLVSQNEKKQLSPSLVETVLRGDLSKLSEAQRNEYVLALCNATGLNPALQPFEYMSLQGKLTLYLKKSGAEQLRNLHHVAIKVISREVISDVAMVTIQGSTPDGRIDESIGAVFIGNLKGEALANAFMKAETKAKRRVTLSLTGLGAFEKHEQDNQSIPQTRYNFNNDNPRALRPVQDAETTSATNAVLPDDTGAKGASTDAETVKPEIPEILQGMATSAEALDSSRWNKEIEAHRKLVGAACKQLKLDARKLHDKEKLAEYLTGCEPTLEVVTNLMREFYVLE